MHVVMPDQGIPIVAPAGSSKPVETSGAAPAAGIFATLLAALQQAAVDGLPAEGSIVNGEAGHVDASEITVAEDVADTEDASAAEPAEQPADDAVPEHAEALAAIGPVLANAITALTGGANAAHAGGGKASGETPAPASIQNVALANPDNTNAGGQSVKALAHAVIAAVSTKNSSTGTPHGALVSQQVANTGAATPALTTPPRTAAPTDVAAATIAVATNVDGTSVPQSQTAVSAAPTGKGTGQSSQAASAIVAANIRGNDPNVATVTAGDAVRAQATTAVTASNEAAPVDSPRFVFEGATIEEVSAGTKPGSDASLLLRPGDLATVSADKSGAVVTAAATAQVGTDAQTSVAANGVQARNDTAVNAPALPQAPEPPPRPTPTDLTQFAVKSVRYLAGRGEETMTVRLVPESLGELRVVVRTGEHSLDVQLSAVNASVRDSLEQQLPALREALARDAGDARQVTITINTGTDQQSAGSQFARQFAAAGQFENHSGHDQPDIPHEAPRAPARQTAHSGQLDVRA